MTDILRAVAENTYTPEELSKMIRYTFDVAKERQDAKNMLEVIKFVVAYAVGKPVARSLIAQVDPDMLRGMLMDEEGEEDDGDDDAIDVAG